MPVTLIGDLVGSRELPDRAAVQARLDEALTALNAEHAPLQALEPTVGDEFQGAFADVASALLVGLRIRLRMLPEVDVRCGYGVGEVAVLDGSRRPLLQDGPGWWAAREAIDSLSTPRRNTARGWYVGADDAAYVNAFVTTRDALVDRLNDRGLRMLDLALGGATQQQIAEVEQISKSAVSQQFARGIGAIRDAHATFAGTAVRTAPQE